MADQSYQDTVAVAAAKLKTKPPSQHPNFKAYVDPTGELSSSQLRYGLWLGRHQVLLYRLVLFLLVIGGIVTWGFSLWSWGNYIIFGIPRDAQLAFDLSHFTNYTLFHERLQPAPLQIVSVELLPGGVNTFDAVAEVINPNQRWLANFSYHFVINGVATVAQDGFLLPGQSSVLVSFGSDGGGGSAPTIEITNIHWLKISNHTVADTVAWQADRLNFVVSNFVFGRAGENFDSPTAQRIQFKFSNRSAFGYAAPHFAVGLYANQSLVGVIPLALDKFVSLETKDIDLRSFVPALTADSAQVFPFINVYDPAVYVAPPQ